MSKVTKTPISATIDTWVVNWIREQPEKMSKVINDILKQHIINVAEEPKQQKRLLPLTGRAKQAAFEAHMQRLYQELGWEDE
tara:strand:- start:259 stop:504 length:246 start_codon:yes stop_codon:yes gene_type:complete